MLLGPHFFWFDNFKNVEKTHVFYSFFEGVKEARGFPGKRTIVKMMFLHCKIVKMTSIWGEIMLEAWDGRYNAYMCGLGGAEKRKC